MIKGIQNISGLLREFIMSVVQPGDVVLDATAGRGRDTEFLAECVGPQGKVYAFDIQEEAIRETRERLHLRGFEQRVKLFNLDHARLGEVVQGQLKVVIFNLGYLPGSDRLIVTQAASTINALHEALNRLEVRGLLLLTIYRGHDGAREEANAVDHFCRTLPKKEYSVLEGQYTNQGEDTSYWIIVQKNREAYV